MVPVSEPSAFTHESGQDNDFDLCYSENRPVSSVLFHPARFEIDRVGKTEIMTGSAGVEAGGGDTRA